MPLKGLNQRKAEIVQDHSSDEELNEEINDKLSDLWTGMKDKRREALKSMTFISSSSRRNEAPSSHCFSTGKPNSTLKNIGTQGQPKSSKHPLFSEQQQSKENLANQSNLNRFPEKVPQHSQIEYLMETVAKLSNQNQSLLRQLDSLKERKTKGDYRSYRQINSRQNSQLEDESSIQEHKEDLSHSDIIQKAAQKDSSPRKKLPLRKQSATKGSHTLLNSTSINYKKSQNKTAPHIGNPFSKKQKVNHSLARLIEQQEESLENLSRQRLVELLKTTSEYRQFAYYYDSHELSYLKRMQSMHRKNCPQLSSEIEKKNWAPKEAVLRLKELNKSQSMGLSEEHCDLLLSQLKIIFELSQERQTKRLKDNFKKKLNRIIREKQNKISYDIVRLSNAKDRNQSINSGKGNRKRAVTFKD